MSNSNVRVRESHAEPDRGTRRHRGGDGVGPSSATIAVALTTLTPDARETFDGHLARVASRSLGTPRAAVTS